MQSAYALCAFVGGLVVVLQLGFGLLGLGSDDVDLDVDLESDAGLDLFTVRTLSAFLAVFGLVGWIGTLEGWPRAVTFAVAFASATAVLLLVAWLLRLKRRLESTGTLQDENAVGQVARVYLGIPAAGRGQGKITVVVQGRTAEFLAFTQGEAIPSGAAVRVLRMTVPGTFEVAPLDAEKS
jgi:membrane protein implicated in regulation of membrane protease activity